MLEKRNVQMRVFFILKDVWITNALTLDWWSVSAKGKKLDRCIPALKCLERNIHHVKDFQRLNFKIKKSVGCFSLCLGEAGSTGTAPSLSGRRARALVLVLYCAGGAWTVWGWSDLWPPEELYCLLPGLVPPNSFKCILKSSFDANTT